MNKCLQIQDKISEKAYKSSWIDAWNSIKLLKYSWPTRKSMRQFRRGQMLTIRSRPHRLIEVPKIFNNLRDSCYDYDCMLIWTELPKELSPRVAAYQAPLFAERRIYMKCARVDFVKQCFYRNTRTGHLWIILRRGTSTESSYSQSHLSFDCIVSCPNS